MKQSTLVRNAGIISMVGGALWVISIVLQMAFNLYPPDGEGPLYVFNQILAFTSLVAIATGYFGNRWHGGVTGQFGKISIWAFFIGNLLLVVGGIFALILKTDDTPIFLVFPIGALLMDLGALVTGILVAREGSWQGWTRFMPLIYAAFLWLGIEIPFILGVFPDGPSPVLELVQGVGLFCVGLAIHRNTTKAA